MSDNQPSAALNEETLNETNATNTPETQETDTSTSASSSRLLTETWESMEMMGSQAIDFIREMAQRGNISRVVISQQNGKPVLNITLTAGVLATGAVTLILPHLAGLGLLGLLLARMRIEVVRVERADASPADEPVVDIAVEA